MGKFEADADAVVPMILLTGTRHLQDSRGPATKRQSSLGRPKTCFRKIKQNCDLNPVTEKLNYPVMVATCDHIGSEKN
jgi:hypothetical protein